MAQKRKMSVRYSLMIFPVVVIKFGTQVEPELTESKLPMQQSSRGSGGNCRCKILT